MIDTMEIRKIMVTQKIKDAELARRIGKSAALDHQQQKAALCGFLLLHHPAGIRNRRG